MDSVALDGMIRGLQQTAKAMVIGDEWEDVAQTAIAMHLAGAKTERWSWLVLEAMRRELGWKLRTPLWCFDEKPIASHYPTPDDLIERWQDEETEDQAIEWHRLTAAERDKRVREAEIGTGTTSGAEI